jgi:hypothetical protein
MDWPDFFHPAMALRQNRSRRGSRALDMVTASLGLGPSPMYPATEDVPGADAYDWLAYVNEPQTGAEV